MLRAVSHGILIGAGTMRAEADFTGHIFDQDLEDMRIEAGLPPVPVNIITSLDATDIPFDHLLFGQPEIPVMISTSTAGCQLVQEKLQMPCQIVTVTSQEQVTAELLSTLSLEPGKVLVLGTGETAPDAHLLMYVLRRMGIERLLVETPTYMHYLVSQKLMDELFFNYSCIYVGGQALSIGKYGKEFTSADHPHTRMLSIHSHSDHFFYFRHQLLD